MALRRSCLRLIVAALLLLTAPAPAAAEQRVADARAGELAFAGDGIVYQGGRDKVLDAYAVAGTTELVLVRGRARRTLVRLSTGVAADDEPSSAGLDWAVSSTSLLYRYAYTQYFAAGEETGEEVRGGPLAGPYRRLAKCDDGIGDFVWHAVALSGERGAYVWNCGANPGAVVRSLAPPTSPPEATFDADFNIDLAGPYLSVERDDVEESKLMVVDTRDRRELYEARGFAETDGGIQHSLQADGKLAAHLRGPGDGCTLAWFSPAEPAPHPVGDALCGTPVQIADDRIAYWRARKGRKQLVVRDLRGGETVLATAPYAPVGYDPAGVSTLGSALAFDGTRTAYAIARCDGRSTLLLRSEPPGPVNRDRAPLGCPLSVLSHSLRGSASARTASLPVRCPRGCLAEARVGDSTIDQPFARPRGSGRVTLHLDDTTVERLKRQGRAGVTVRLTTYDRAGRGTDRRLRLTVRG